MICSVWMSFVFLTDLDCGMLYVWCLINPLQWFAGCHSDVVSYKQSYVWVQRRAAPAPSQCTVTHSSELHKVSEDRKQSDYKSAWNWSTMRSLLVSVSRVSIKFFTWPESIVKIRWRRIQRCVQCRIKYINNDSFILSVRWSLWEG